MSKRKDRLKKSAANSAADSVASAASAASAAVADKATNAEAAAKGMSAVPAYYYLLATIGLALTYFIYSFFSQGFYQHDEIAHFLNMKEFWVKPSAIIGSSWAKPGYKLLYVIPALGGAKVVTLFNCMITALAAWVTAKVGRAYGLKYSLLAFVFVGFQAILLQCSFRNYSELLSALTVAALMYFYAKDKWILASIASSYLFLLRSELALISIALGVIYLYRKQFVPFLLLAWAPIALHVAGWIATGDSSFLFSFTFASSGEYTERGFFHFWNMFTPAIGAVVTLFFLRGLFGFLADPEGPVKGLKKLLATLPPRLPDLLALLFYPSAFFTDKAFTFLKLTANFRQLIVVAPAIGFFALLGFNGALDKRYASRLLTLGLGIAYLLIVLATASKQHNYMAYLETPSYGAALALLVVLSGIAGYYFVGLNAKFLAIIIALSGIGLTLAEEKPIELNPRDLVFRDAADWFKQQKQLDPPYIVSNHIVFHHFYGTSGADRVHKFRKINRGLEQQLAIDSVESLPAGSVVFWDTHYSFQQRSTGERYGIPIDHLMNNKDYQPMQQFVTPNRYGVIAFQKVSEAKASPHLLNR